MEVKPRLEIKDNKFRLPYLFEPEQYEVIKYMIENDSKFQELFKAKRVFSKLGDYAYREYSSRSWFIDAFDADLRLSDVIFDDGHKMIDIEFEFLRTHNGVIARKNIEIMCEEIVFTPVMMICLYEREPHIYGFAIIDLLCKTPMSKNSAMQEILFDVKQKMEAEKKEKEEIVKPVEAATIINTRKEYDRDINATIKFIVEDNEVYMNLFDEYEEFNNPEVLRQITIKSLYPKLSKYKNYDIRDSKVTFDIEEAFFYEPENSIEVVIKDLSAEDLAKMYEHTDIRCSIRNKFKNTEYEIIHFEPMTKPKENIEDNEDINDNFVITVENCNFDKENDTIYDYVYISQKGRTPVIAKCISYDYDKENKNLLIKLQYSKEIFDEWLKEVGKLEINIGFNAGTDRARLATKYYSHNKFYRNI